MTEPTSIESYHAALESGFISAKQQAVIKYMSERLRGVTQREVNLHFKDPNRSYAPRFKELEDSGVIQCVGTVRDMETNRSVKEYRLTGRVPTHPVRRKATALFSEKETNQLVTAVKTAFFKGLYADIELGAAMNILKKKGLA